MQRYLEIAKQCGVFKNSNIYVNKDSLNFFVRLMINDETKNLPFIRIGYITGLFDGSGNVDFDSVSQFYKKISEEIIKLEKQSNKFNVIHELGIHLFEDVSYKKENNLEEYSSKKYLEIAKECDLFKNNEHKINVNTLNFFVRLMLNDETKNLPFIRIGYITGLFDGSGNVDFNSVSQFYKKISEEISKIEKELTSYQLMNYFDIDPIDNIIYKTKIKRKKTI